MPLTNCGSTSPVPVIPAVTKCSIPEIPDPPALVGAVCGDKICLSIAEVTSLSVYQAKIVESKTALKGCSLVKLVAY